MAPGGVLYPCPVLAGDSRDDPTAWIRADGNDIAVGVAHGSVENAAYDSTPANITRCCSAERPGLSGVGPFSLEDFVLG